MLRFYFILFFLRCTYYVVTVYLVLYLRVKDEVP